MSKFRSRQLDASKPIPIYFHEDIYDSSEFNNVTNRSVPQLPTGMEKEEETEHHLQQAIFHHRVIPVPEVYESESHNDKITFDQLYPPNFKPSRQFIHIHPFSMDQDIPDYDMDSEDEDWLQEHTRKGELLPLMPSQFEEMMDRLEKASGLKAVTLQEAKLLLKDDDDLITAVYDYWLNKRLNLQHTLIPQVKSEKGGNSSTTDPYVAFRKRTEKMQTRKNRKNDETSYEKMLKLRRDLERAIALLEMVKRREKTKRELLHINIEVHEKRYEMEDFSGTILNEVNNQRLLLNHRPAFAPIIPNHQQELEEAESENLANNLWHKVPSRTVNKVGKRRDDGRRERRPYKKKKRSLISNATSSSSHLPRSFSHPTDHYSMASMYSQGGSNMLGISEDDLASTSHSEAEDEATVDGYFAFRRNALVSYLAPQDSALPDESAAYSLASISQPHDQLIGRCRRRVGRGGRILLDRIPPLESSNGAVIDGQSRTITKNERLHFRPCASVETDSSSSSDDDFEVDVETVGAGTTSRIGRRRRGDEIVPSSVFIRAEILEGIHKGIVTELNVTIPPNEQNLDFSSNSSVLPEDNNIARRSRSSSTSSRPGDDTSLTSASYNVGTGAATSITSCSVISTVTTTNVTSSIGTRTAINSSAGAVQQHSDCVYFHTQPLSKFADVIKPSVAAAESSNVTSSLSMETVSKNYSSVKSIAPSLNSLICASSKKDELQRTKKLMNLSSIYIRQPKNSAQTIPVPSGFLLANRNNGNNVLSNSQKLLWSNNSEVTTNSNSDTVLSNGPSSKPNLKCTKVTPILFHET